MSSHKKLLKIFTVITAVAIISAIILSLFIPRVTQIVENKIAVIDIYGPIVFGEQEQKILDMIDRATKAGGIKAVILRINSPGGAVAAVQNIYASLMDLKEKKPVVAFISGLGVSGAYYIAVASDYIYCLPSSMVGNIGAIGFLPQKVKPEEWLIETGPYKRIGIKESDFPFRLQEILKTFLNVVVEGRGEKLKLNATELSKGLIYFGEDAVNYGLVDEIGSFLDAVKKAAELAKLPWYEVVELGGPTEEGKTSHSNSSATSMFLDVNELLAAHPPPSFYYLYMPYTETNTTFAMSDMIDERFGESKRKIAVIDMAHQNAFTLTELTPLLSELVLNGFAVRFYEGGEIDSILEEASVFITINPTVHFSNEEVKKLGEYKGKIILIADPTRGAYAINSLAGEFELVFASGYLYSLNENNTYGNYRNIVIDDFESSILSEGIERIVLFTATHIYHDSGQAFITEEDTYLSGIDRPGMYTPIVLKDNVLAIADFTLLTEPYCYIADNYRFLENIIKFVS